MIKKLPSVIKAIRRDLPPPAPFRATLQITDQCNLRCEYCLQHSFLKEPHRGRGHVPVARIFALIDELADMGTREVCLLGQGEPSLHPKFPDIVRRIKAAGMRLIVYTNLSMPPSRAEAYAMADRLLVNLSGPDEQAYDLIHAPSGSKVYQRVLYHLGVLKKKRAASSFPVVDISYIVTRRNYHLIARVFEIGRDNGIDLLQFTNPLLIPATRKLALGVGERKEFISNLMQLTHRFPQVRTNARDVIMELLSEQRTATAFGRCFMGWLTLSVDVGGHVCLCSRNRRLDVGVWEPGTLRKLWEGPRAQRYRRLAQHALERKDLFGRECLYCSHADTNARLEALLHPAHAGSVHHGKCEGGVHGA